MLLRDGQVQTDQLTAAQHIYNHLVHVTFIYRSPIMILQCFYWPFNVLSGRALDLRINTLNQA